ncbi:hypothetical protein [Frateuria defendens]|uniref:hypothetical protein n=1 Tax=Frateuria defendens TaxID=2219559 RepID=UPI00066FDAB5|nr:hypothetical protein [Frateuria defendens]
MPAILEGIRAGHVFIDTEGSRDRLLELEAGLGAQHATMGDALRAGAGERVHVTVHAAHVAGARLALWLDGRPLAAAIDTRLDGEDVRRGFDWTGDGRPHWLRAEVLDAVGKPLLIGNPVYVNPLR